MNDNDEIKPLKTALVIGCNGTFGSAIALELVKQGWHVKALLRDSKKRPDWLDEKHVHVGDCCNMTDLQQAAKGVDLLVYGANPIYHQWSEKAESMMEPTVQVAEINHLHILFPGNVYGYNPLCTPLICEASKTEVITEKGRIRIKMEERLLRATKNGATVTVFRCGDFLAKNAESSWFNHLLTKNKSGWSLSNPSVSGHEHCYAWLPDAAANAVALVALDKKGFNVWHEAGIVASHDDWLTAMQKLNLNVNAKRFAWWQLKIVALFNPTIKEVLKMRYIWQQSLLLDGSKMQRALGHNYRRSSLTNIVETMTNM